MLFEMVINSNIISLNFFSLSLLINFDLSICELADSFPGILYQISNIPLANVPVFQFLFIIIQFPFMCLNAIFATSSFGA